MNSQQIIEVAIVQLRSNGLYAQLEVNEIEGNLTIGNTTYRIMRRGLSTEGLIDNLLLRALVVGLGELSRPVLDANHAALAEDDQTRVG